MTTPEAFARRTDPRTSHDAAASLDGALTEIEARVLSALRARGPDGATSHELASALNLSLVTVSPRLRPLVGKGLVIDSGFRRVGASGRRSIVWRAKTVGLGEQQKLL